MRTILVPLDGSTFAEDALTPARRIARRSGARLELVAVHEPALVAHRGRSGSPNEQRFDVTLRQELTRYLNGVKAGLLAADADIPVEAWLLDGPVIETLARHVETTAPDLIVLTTHARGGPSRAWLGSVTDGLLRSTAIPVLAVRPCVSVPTRASDDAASRVLVALDGAPENERAVDDAVAVAGSDDVEYVLLRVVAPLHPLLQAIATEQAYQNDLVQERRAAEAYLATLVDQLRSRGLQARGEVRVDANAAASIVACADELGADLIALATHARGAVGRAVLGSVADKVLRTASTPVLLHRSTGSPPGSEQPMSPGGTVARARPQDHAATRSTTLPTVRLRRLLVATDFAEPSQRAAAWAARYLGRDVELVIMNAVTIPKPPHFLGQSVPARDELCESARRGAEVRMRELSRIIRTDGVWTEVRCGNTANEIVAAATDYAADIIVMADRGEPTRLARLLGGTVQRVVRAARTPVFLGRNLTDASPRRILVAVDESPEMPHVLAWACLLASRFGASLVAVHAVEPMISRAVQMGTPGVEPQQTLDDVAATVTRWLESRVPASGTSAPAITTTVTFGDPGPEILATATRAAADMIVMGRGGAGRALAAVVGSVTDHVLRIGDGPVLVVPAPAEWTADA